MTGPTVVSEYYNRPEGTDADFDDSWLKTGDIVTLDEDRYIEIVDRAQDIVENGGKWISSIELENELMAHPVIIEAAVIGVSHEKWQERPFAYVVTAEDSDVDTKALPTYRKENLDKPAGGFLTRSGKSQPSSKLRPGSSTNGNSEHGLARGTDPVKRDRIDATFGGFVVDVRHVTSPRIEFSRTRRHVRLERFSMPLPDITDSIDRANQSSGEHTDGCDPTTDRPMSTDDIVAIYADMADRIDRWSRCDRLVTGRYRRRQFGSVQGRVLDVACGTGLNFPCLPATVELVGIDVSPDMLTKAQQTLNELAVEGSLHRMDAAMLAFPNDSFDAVISSLSTCTFPDPVAVLREMRRVCKPDGRILLLEHGRSDVGPIARLLDWRAEAHYEETGCRWNQEPLDLVREAGLPIVDADRAVFGLLTRIEASPSPLGTPS